MMPNLRSFVAQCSRLGGGRSIGGSRHFSSSATNSNGGSGSSGGRPWFPTIDPTSALACFIYGALVHASWDTYLVMKVEEKAALAWKDIEIQLQSIEEELKPKLAGRDKQRG